MKVKWALSIIVVLLLSMNVKAQPEARADEVQMIIYGNDELSGCTLWNGVSPNFIQGDFFGDGIEDFVVLVKDSSRVKIAIINKGVKNEIFFIGGEKEMFHMFDYSWIGVFKKIPAGDVLWSNYEDDFRTLEETPDDEKVYLNYDALYVHAIESCGGGFIFWKDDKWNWLQQE